MKRRGGDPDDGEFVLVDRNGSADDGWIGMEVGAPVTIADDNDGKLSGSIGEFRGQEEPADLG